MLKEIPYLGRFFNPEYYHEVQNYDCRIAIRKFLDLYLTLGDAITALTYSSLDEYEEDNMETQIIRRTHLRHALIDLNNSFDLLIQVPWFYYRIGLQNHPNIQRNTIGWVEKLEAKCSLTPILNFLSASADGGLQLLFKKISNFKDSFLCNDTKPFTVRELVNTLKHRSILKLEEFDSPLKLNLNGIEQIEQKTGLKQDEMKVEIVNEFYDFNNPTISIGKTKITSKKYALVDIEYYGSDFFRGEDYSYTSRSFSMNSIYDEAVAYYECFIDLLECLYETIYLEIPQSPILDKNKVKLITTAPINLNKWYKK